MLKLRNGAVCCLLIALGLSCSVPQPSPTGHQAVMSSNTNEIADVDAFMRTDQQPGRAASVEGVVARVDASTKMIALIDKGEYEKCSSTTCSALYLPVRWTGTMPKEEDTVVVQGEVTAEGTKLLFVAKAIRKVASAQEGANHETP